MCCLAGYLSATSDSLPPNWSGWVRRLASLSLCYNMPLHSTTAAPLSGKNRGVVSGNIPELYQGMFSFQIASPFRGTKHV